MWSNGFLQTIELRPRSPIPDLPGWLKARPVAGMMSRYQTGRFRVTAATVHGSGRWNLETADGERYDVRLTGGWIGFSGSFMGLAWERLGGQRSGPRTFRAWLVSSDHDRQTWRRLNARLRTPLSGPV
jgi:hypothetical protein